MNKKIFISTGEVSGDLHGSLLSKALFDEAKKKSIDLEICGLGGERMKNEGVKILQSTLNLLFKSNDTMSSSLEKVMTGELDLSSSKLCSFLKESISKERRGPMPVANL